LGETASPAEAKRGRKTQKTHRIFIPRLCLYVHREKSATGAAEPGLASTNVAAQAKRRPVSTVRIQILLFMR
jgi:hypothetical protein